MAWHNTLFFTVIQKLVLLISFFFVHVVSCVLLQLYTKSS
jgi:hypothetical protein